MNDPWSVARRAELSSSIPALEARLEAERAELNRLNGVGPLRLAGSIIEVVEGDRRCVFAVESRDGSEVVARAARAYGRAGDALDASVRPEDRYKPRKSLD